MGLMSPNCVEAAVLTQVINDSAIKSQRIMKANSGRGFYDQTIEIWNDGKQPID